jgi:MarR family transcriptional regulator, organic hydroperoxide resistance regulator
VTSSEPATMATNLASLEREAGINSQESQEVVRQFMWEISSIYAYLQEIRQFQAKLLGITGPQWTILMALADLDKQQGVPVNVVSKLMHVDSSFITTQSKLLEKKGFLRRKSSAHDARVVQMSLTDKTYKHLASVVAQQKALDKFVFGEFGVRELTDFTSRLTAIKYRLQKARLKVALDF